MAIDLFGLFLGGMISGAGSWFSNRLLDTATRCGSCGHSHDRSIENQATTRIYCPRCSNNLSQYSNATSHTVNQNGGIGVGYISSIHWDRWRERFDPELDVDTVNARGHDLVLRLILSEFNGYQFYQDDMILRPRYESSYWRELGWRIPRRLYPVDRCTVAVDVLLFNTWGDELHRARSLADYSGRDDDD